jgi:hypothetical protein
MPPVLPLNVKQLKWTQTQMLPKGCRVPRTSKSNAGSWFKRIVNMHAVSHFMLYQPSIVFIAAKQLERS